MIIFAALFWIKGKMFCIDGKNVPQQRYLAAFYAIKGKTELYKFPFYAIIYKLNSLMGIEAPEPKGWHGMNKYRGAEWNSTL